MAKNEDCHKQQEPFNNKLLLLCWMFYWTNFLLILPGRLGFCAHSTAFTLPHTSTTDSESREVRKTQNCSFISNVHCCLLLLLSVARAQVLQILSVWCHFPTVTGTEAQPKPRQSHLSHTHPGKQGFWNPAGKDSQSHTPSAFKRPLTTASQYQENVITGLRDQKKNSTWYQSTRTGTVSKLTDLSPCTTLSLAVCFCALWCQQSWEMLLCRFSNIKIKQPNFKHSQLNMIYLENHLIPVQIFCPL